MTTTRNIIFGDILSVTEGIIVHGCNNHGVMGSGIAFQIKNKYPKAYHDYRKHLMMGSPQEMLGKVGFSEVAHGLVIANAITQDGFGKDGKKYVSYKAIAECFAEISINAEAMGVDVHYPLIGAGLGGGDWSIISDIIYGIFDNFPSVKHTLWIYE